jgi:phage major head subunit gpT-like protein
LNENGEFKNKAILDGEKATITAATKGNIINVSRQMIVNDDMNAFSRLPELLGRAAALSVEVDAYALLLRTAVSVRRRADTQALFHSNRTNVGTGAALSAASLDADAAVMAAQKDPNGQEFLALEPAVLLVPRTLKGQALVINDSQYDPDTLANKSQMKPNVARGFFRTIVGTPRLTGTRRYLFADPTLYPVFEVAFLDGQMAPVLETQDGWRADGAEMKVRFDYGVAAVDFRGAVTNAGV